MPSSVLAESFLHDADRRRLLRQDEKQTGVEKKPQI